LQKQLAALRTQLAETARNLELLHSQQAQAQRDLATAEAQRTTAADRADAARADQRRRTVARPPVPASSPAAAQPPQEADIAQDVIDRLRHQAPPAAPPPSEPRRFTDTATFGQLRDARNALAAGHIEDARRALQVAQLRLVFRPVGADGVAPPPAGRSAADVARALSLLGIGATDQAMRAIDQALSDSGDGARYSQSGEADR
jgi:hypothetical protein